MIPTWIVNLLRGQSPGRFGPQPPFNLDQFNAEMDVALSKVQDLISSLDDPNNLARKARNEIRAETGVSLDANPYFKQNEREKLGIIILTAKLQTESPGTVHALWMKETSAVPIIAWNSRPDITTQDHAISLFIANNFFRTIGADIFTRFIPARRRGQDNRILLRDEDADDHKQVLTEAGQSLYKGGFAAKDYAPILRQQVTVTRVGQVFKVDPKPLYHAAMLAMTMAHFNRIRREPNQNLVALGVTYPLSDDLTYLIYNSGLGSPSITDRGAYTVFKSAKDRAQRNRTTIEHEVLHTHVPSQNQARKNVIRFMYYRRCYTPVYQ